MTNYLAAIDIAEDDSWQSVVETAINMAKGVEDAKLYLMTVIPGIHPGIDQRYAVRGEMKGSAEYPLQQWKDDAEARLQEIGKKHIPKSLFAGVVVENGTIYREIVEAAKDLNITQIVMGANKPSLTDYLLGPNSARVARHAECTVTVVR